MHFDLPEELKTIKKAIREFSQKEVKPAADEYYNQGTYPRDLIRRAAGLGYIAPFIPEEYGGAGEGALVDALVKEETTRTDPMIGMMLISYIGAKMIIKHGTQEQKKRYLPHIAQGEQICGICITEPKGGSDVSGIQTSAQVTSDGYILNGTKTFITNAPHADLLIVIARTDPEPHRGLSTFIVETDNKGVDIKPIEIMGKYPSPGEVALNDVMIPRENLVGELNRGFYQTMEWLDGSRSWVSSYALGVAQGAFDLALDYAKKREQFGQPIFNFQDIRFKLADMAIKVEAARLMCYKLCELEDEGVPRTQFASMTKLFVTEAAAKASSDAMMIYGAYGTSTEYQIQRYYTCAKISPIIEGTSQIHHEIVAKRL